MSANAGSYTQGRTAGDLAIADLRFPVKPKDGLSGKIHTENHCGRPGS